MRVWLAVAVVCASCSNGIGEGPNIDASPLPATCGDGERNGDETDIDCGGSCEVCEVGAGCAAPSDCETGLCPAGTCTLAASCKQILDNGENQASGVYPLGPGDEAFDAFCDMTTSGGGWTLIARLDSSGSAFVFDSVLWTTAAILDDSALQPLVEVGGEEAKLRAFNEVSGGELRLQFVDPAVELVYDGLGAQTALELFAGPEVLIAGDESDGCHGDQLSAAPGFDPATMRHARGHQFYGVNGTDTGADGLKQLRFGFASNDEPGNSWFARQAVGSTDASVVWNGQTDCSECNGCYGTLYEPAATAVNLWVR